MRSDGDIQMGTCHLMRCLALGQAWQDAGGQVIFMTAVRNSALKARLEAEGMRVAQPVANPGSDGDALQTVQLGRRLGSSWVVVDGYHFNSRYQALIKEAGLKLLYIDDDVHVEHYYADLVLNVNLHARPELYARRESYTLLLLGSQYALLRREFEPWRQWQREINPNARRILVTMWGADHDNATARVLQALEGVGLSGLEITVILGGAYPHRRQLEKILRKCRHSVHLEQNVMQMTEIMAWADLAISAGGGTCWEMAFMRLPNLILVLAENQRPIAEHLDNRGIAVNLGWHRDFLSQELQKWVIRLLNSPRERAARGNRGRELVGGKGGSRVVAAMLEVQRND